jgi:hypothetical protein
MCDDVFQQLEKFKKQTKRLMEITGFKVELTPKATFADGFFYEIFVIHGETFKKGFS